MVTAIIVAAGRGTRMGADVDKIFLELAGKPIIAHTWSRFDASPEIDQLILVVRDGMQAEFERLRQDYTFKKAVHFVPGGKERQDSVWNGLQALDGASELVLIQDGARPCTTLRTIAATLAAAREFGAAVAAQKVTDTIKEANELGRIARNVDRSRLWAVQTPQVFQTAILRRAMEEVITRKLLITDDTAACELIGQPVKLVDCADPNPKATSPADLPYLELLLAKSSGPW